jgi:hypothetical protein
MVNYYNIAGRKIGSHHVRSFVLPPQHPFWLRQEYNPAVDDGFEMFAID